AGDLVDGAERLFDAFLLGSAHEPDELLVRALFHQKLGERDALCVVKAPRLGAWVVDGHQLAELEDTSLPERAGQLGGSADLLVQGFGEDGHAFVGPAGNLLLSEQVSQYDVSDLVR